LTTPSVTTRWPALSPSTISTRPFWRSPVRTCTRLALPLTTVKTNRFSPSPTSASSGTAGTVRSADSIVTVSSMPGFSLRSPFASTARTVAARVCGFRTGSTVSTVPRNGWSG